MLYANSLLKQEPKSELILPISQCCSAVQRLELSSPGGNSFDFQHFLCIFAEMKLAQFSPTYIYIWQSEHQFVVLTLIPAA